MSKRKCAPEIQDGKQSCRKEKKHDTEEDLVQEIARLDAAIASVQIRIAACDHAQDKQGAVVLREQLIVLNASALETRRALLAAQQVVLQQQQERVGVLTCELDPTLLEKLDKMQRSKSKEVLMICNKIDITAKTLRRLKGSTWLNDELVNASMSLLNDRDRRAAGGSSHRVWCTNSFFFKKLCSRGYDGVRRWPQRAKVQIWGDLERIIIPIHLPGHWVCVLVDLKALTLTLYDSMGSPGRRVMETIWEKFLQPCRRDMCGDELDRSKWSFLSPRRSVPQQNNGHDCGVFMVCFATCLTDPFVGSKLGLPFDMITQENMRYFRKQIGVNILRKYID